VHAKSVGAPDGNGSRQAEGHPHTLIREPDLLNRADEDASIGDRGSFAQPAPVRNDGLDTLYDPLASPRGDGDGKDNGGGDTK
jgi:hypothetical protein